MISVRKDFFWSACLCNLAWTFEKRRSNAALRSAGAYHALEVTVIPQMRGDRTSVWYASGIAVSRQP